MRDRVTGDTLEFPSKVNYCTLCFTLEYRINGEVRIIGGLEWLDITIIGGLEQSEGKTEKLKGETEERNCVWRN